MGISKEEPLGNNRDVCNLHQLILHGFSLHDLTQEAFGEADPKIGELASRYVAFFGMITLLDRKFPVLREQHEVILSELQRSLDIALSEIELSNYREMKSLGFI